jgi:hypothetical protein
MPIGLTASGEIVFPIQCKEFIEQKRGKIVEQNPSAVEEKKPEGHSDAPASENSKPPIKPLGTVKPSKRFQNPNVPSASAMSGSCAEEAAKTLKPMIPSPEPTKAMTGAVIPVERFAEVSSGKVCHPFCRGIREENCHMGHPAFR